MKKSYIASALAAAAVIMALVGCSGTANYNDGTYTARSQEYVNNEDESVAGNGYGEVTLTIKDNKITDCTFVTYELDGTQKDENYGKENGEIKNKDFYMAPGFDSCIDDDPAAFGLEEYDISLEIR